MPLDKSSFQYGGLLIAAILCTHCATGPYTRGTKLVKNGSYTEAVQVLRVAELQRPQDAKIKRELGVAHYKLKQFDQAIDKLGEARGLDPKDGKTVFYLGLSHEGKGDLASALAAYRTYQTLSGSGGFKQEISKRIKQLANEKIVQEIRLAISNEQSISTGDIPDNTVAVLYFANLGQFEELNPLSKGIAQMLITDLSKVKKLQVVERLKLQRLLEELQLGTSGVVDEATAPRVGRLIGANKLVKGSFTDLAGASLRIDASLAETSTAQILEVDEVSGKLEALLKLAKDLVFSVIYDLDVTLTREEREAIQKIPTESLLAFMAYSKALDFEDRGLFDQAKQEYQKAVALDPNFALAQQGLSEVDAAKSAAAAPKIAATQFETEFASQENTPQVSSRISRLVTTGLAAQTGQTPQGDNDTRKPVEEATGADTGLVSSAATLRVRIRLPDIQQKQ